MDSVGGLEELLNGISSLNMDSFDAVDLFELEQNLADLDLGYGIAPFISAAGKGKGAKKAKESKPAKKSVKVKAATAKSAKGKGKRAMEDDDADDVEENPPLDPVPMEPLSLTRVKVPRGSIYVDASTSFIPNTLRPRYRFFARAYDRFLSTSQSLLSCQAFLDTIDSMTIHEALASFESQFGFIHPAGPALIAIRNRIISVRRHNVENNLEGETQFSIVPQLYKCPQGMIDGLDHCSCFTGDWTYSINQATFDVLQETHAATVFPLSGSSEQLRKELVSRRQNVVPTVVFILSLNRYLFCPKILLDVGVYGIGIGGFSVGAGVGVGVGAGAEPGTGVGAGVGVGGSGSGRGSGSVGMERLVADEGFTAVGSGKSGILGGSSNVLGGGGVRDVGRTSNVLGGGRQERQSSSVFGSWPQRPRPDSSEAWKKDHFILMDILQNQDYRLAEVFTEQHFLNGFCPLCRTSHQKSSDAATLTAFEAHLLAQHFHRPASSRLTLPSRGSYTDANLFNIHLARLISNSPKAGSQDDTCPVCLQDGYCQDLIRHMIESHPNYDPAVPTVPTAPVAPLAPVAPVVPVVPLAPVVPVVPVAPVAPDSPALADPTTTVAPSTSTNSVVNRQLVAGSDASRCVTLLGIMDARLVNQAFEMGSSHVYSVNHPATAAHSMRPGSYPIWIKTNDGKQLKPPRTAMTNRELKLHDFIVLRQLAATWQAFTNGDPTDLDMFNVYHALKNQDVSQSYGPYLAHRLDFAAANKSKLSDKEAIELFGAVQQYNKKGGIKNVTGVIVETLHWTNSARLLNTPIHQHRVQVAQDNQHRLNLQVDAVGNVVVGGVDVLHDNEDVEMGEAHGLGECQLFIDATPISPAFFLQSSENYTELMDLSKLMLIGLSLLNKKVVGRSLKVQKNGMHHVFQSALTLLNGLADNGPTFTNGEWYSGSVLFKHYSKAPDFTKEPMTFSGATELGVVFFKNKDSKISHILPLFQVLATTSFNPTRNQPVSAKIKVLGLHSILVGETVVLRDFRYQTTHLLHVGKDSHQRLYSISQSFIRPDTNKTQVYLWNELISPAWTDTLRRVRGHSVAVGIQNFVAGLVHEQPASLVSVSGSQDNASVYRNNFNTVIRKLLSRHPKFKNSNNLVLNAAIATHFGRGRVAQPMSSPLSISKLGYANMRAVVQRWLKLEETLPYMERRFEGGAQLTLDFVLNQRVQERFNDEDWDFVFAQHNFPNLTLQTNILLSDSKVLNIRPVVVSLDGSKFTFKHTRGYKGAHMSGTMPSQRVPQLGEVPRNWSNNNQYEVLFLPLFKQNKTGDSETESDKTKSDGPIEIEEVQVLKQPRRKIDTSIFELDNKKIKQMAPKVLSGKG
ncbi:hypothetical protein BCR33DRAFT_590537 [Rhizoclosmatium globosum]|uniref:Uncharacterized protein n=1 Tax=Rhizoclosmatium globosum TaxID=329046 RepID=A0A1Y2B1J6_9FUNG|nr:hypothetical protein BCR33DRAFT_590537 [Rhizoclosmatium globosum]|eukprot:ORY28709.1 hypothetical protein BCR33DRAFT_590537 [Rhizoclosmatium globosum]